MAPRKIADKLVQKVLIRLDGKDWPIVVTHNVLIECEELTGFNLLDLQGGVSMIRPSAKLMRGMLYLTLKRAGAEYTLEEVGDLITPKNLVLINQGILKAWEASIPEPEESEGGPIKAVE
jgi:hypothetical protein